MVDDDRVGVESSALALRVGGASDASRPLARERDNLHCMADDERDLSEVTLERWGRVFFAVGFVVCLTQLIVGLIVGHGTFIVIGALGVVGIPFHHLVTKPMAKRADQRRTDAS